MAGKRSRHFIWAYVTLFMLLPMGLATASRPGAGDAEPYHRKAKEMIAATSYRIGDWYGTDQKVTTAATALLKPNVILNRQYENVKTKRRATLLLVHCRDARDMGGHYPPNCYPNAGYTMRSNRERVWQIGDLQIKGMEYEFWMDRLRYSDNKVVMNFLVLPNGEIGYGMEGIRTLAADYTRRFYGAGQVQVLVDSKISQTERDAIFCELVGELQDVIKFLLAGAVDE